MEQLIRRASCISCRAGNFNSAHLLSSGYAPESATARASATAATRVANPRLFKRAQAK